MIFLLVFLLCAGSLATGVLLGRVYSAADPLRQKQQSTQADAYIRTVNLLLSLDDDAAIDELVAVVSKNVEDVEPYFALGSLFRNRGDWERALRIHQAILLRSSKNTAQCIRARFQMAKDYKSAGMPKRATLAMEQCLMEDPTLSEALRSLCSLYEEQGRYEEAAASLAKLGHQDARKSMHSRANHLLCAAVQKSVEENALDDARRLLKTANKSSQQNAHLHVVNAEYLSAMGDWKEAALHYASAARLEPQWGSMLVPCIHATFLELFSALEQEQLAYEATVECIGEIQGQIGEHRTLALALLELEVTQTGKNLPETLLAFQEKWTGNLLYSPRLSSARAWRLPSENVDDQSSEYIHEQESGHMKAVVSSLYGTWQCRNCFKPSNGFFWRCESCRLWGVATRTCRTESN